LLLRLKGTDLNPLRLRQGCLWNTQRQHALLEFRFDLVFIDTLRELECADKRAVAALDNLVTIVLALFTLAPLLAANRKHAVLGDDLDLLRFEPRQLQFEPDLLFVFLDVYRWSKIAA